MALSKPKSLRRRVINILLVSIGILVLSVLSLHIWFVNNARGVLKQIVADKSHGKVKLELSQLSFDFFSNKLQIREADLVSTDTVNQATTYHVKFRKLTLHIHSFWPLVLQKKLLLDSIKLHDPDIEVFNWRKDTVQKRVKNELSVPQEMGKLYNSMLDVLDAFGIRRIVINNARLRLIDKTNPVFKPVVVSKIYFDLQRTDRELKRRDEYIANEQNVELRTSDQRIDLPSGRHQLSFKTFNLQLFQKRVELDSCTVTALPTDSSRSSYTIFFDKLSLVGVDFDAMYRYNLIRADSVYCERPYFEIRLDPDLQKAGAGAKKAKPDFEKILRELTGDLDLAFVGVKDAGIHIDIVGSKKRSLFNSSRDNFEMRGFRINADSAKPVAVDRFDMLVRDYRLYNADSSTAYSFDSIHFVNNKIVLNNFSVMTESSRSKQRDLRDFTIPLFELTGLDWFELVFSQNLQAEEAALYDPIINFKKNIRSIRKKTNLFASLQSLDSLMTLQKIRIINGQVNMQFGSAATLILQDLNLSLYSNSFMKSKNKEGLRRAVELLSFSKGLIRVKDITARLENIRFTGQNLLHCDQLSVSSSSNSINGVVNDVYIDNMLVNDEARTILLDGLRWKNASLTVHSLPASGKKTESSRLRLKNISGANTRLTFSNGKTSISTFLRSARIASLSKNRAGPVQIQGLYLSGDPLTMSNEEMQVKAASYVLAGDGLSYLSKVNVERVRQRDSLSLRSDRVNFRIDINEALEKNIHLTDLGMQSPLISFRKWNSGPGQGKTRNTSLRIDNILVTEPDISIVMHRNDSVTSIGLPRSGKSEVKLSGLAVDREGLRIASLSVATTSASMIKATGDTLGVASGKLDLGLSDIRLLEKNGKPFWQGDITHLDLENPYSFKVGKNKNKLVLERMSVGNVRLSSDYLSNLNQLMRANISAWVRGTTGSYVDSNTTLKWYNAEYNYGKKSFRLDSFSYYPTQSRDSVIARTPFQTDYITLHTGPVRMIDFDLERYEKDSALIVNTMEVDRPVITVYRDKRPPFLAGIIKPLPVAAIRRIALPVAIDRINIHEGSLGYSERHARSRAEGTLVLKHINGSLANIKNADPDIHDSLSLALTAYLMDSAFIDLKVKESYTDSLNSFLMTLRMRPTSLSFLNPVLAPLSNVKISTGRIDSFQLRAIGRDDVAFGEMKMFYRNLRIKLIKGGDQNKSTFFTNVLSSLLNTFFVKKNNNGRTGLVYFKRLRDRSFFNYIVKTTFSGIATSIGVVKNRKYLKKYKRELKDKNLPAIEFD
jgi:hypothetical protein